MKRHLLLPILFLAGALGASAISCGTVAVPGACVLNIGGQVQFTFSNFTFINGVATGTQPVTAADIGLNVNAGSGLSAVLSMNKLVTQANPNVVFLANNNDNNNFRFSYEVAVAPLVPGTVLFIDPAKVELVTSSFSNNGVGIVQLTMAGAPICLATTGSPVDTCTLPPGTTNLLTSIGTIVNLSGNTGNASIGTFTNTLNASFTPEPSNGVPEPSTYAMFAAGLAAIYRLRRR
jgi:hypothetical protein